jgi:hypothetical protein
MEQILREYPFRTVLSLKPLVDYLKKTLREPSEMKPCSLEDVERMLEKAPELYGPIENPALLDRHRETFQRLMGFVFPPAEWDGGAVGAVIPFSIEPFFVSPRFRELFISGEGELRGRLNVGQGNFNRGRVIRAYLFILEKFYGIQKSFDYPIIRIVADPKTGLDRHFRMKIDLRFVEARAADDPPALTDQDLDYIGEHLTEPEVLREMLPPENFELHGFTVLEAVEVTESEVLSALQRDLIDRESITSSNGFLRLQQRLRTLFRRADLIAGLTTFQDDQVLLLNTGCEMNHSCIFADSHHVPKSYFKGTVFEQAVKTETIVRIPDIREDPALCNREKNVVQDGIRSMLITPLLYQGECIGTLELGSYKARDFTPMDSLLVNQIQPLFSAALKRALVDFDNNVQSVIKEKCTAVHPAVEWRFRKAALNHLEELRQGSTSEMEPIIFHNLYPLYGVADIRGSTEERNNAIQADLAKQLELALEVVRLADQARPLLILQELATRIEGRLKRLRAGLGSGDEMSVVVFLRKELETLFAHLEGFGPKVIKAIADYKAAIDPGVGTIYQMRKDFEDSVSILNERLAGYLDREEAEIQSVLPHYFERHRTDGVDYLIYAGQSILEQGEFNRLYLKNLRLWQIMVTCGMAWHTEHLKPSLKVPLDTAHLILVQDSPLAIRFRFDEKRFDVDGAYDIRHEIIKARIDKALVKGGKERLTQPGQVAIVYSSPEEGHEMRRHIEFLSSFG